LKHNSARSEGVKRMLISRRGRVAGVVGVCEVQIRVCVGCETGLFKSPVKHIQILSQVFLHRSWGGVLYLVMFLRPFQTYCFFF